MGGGMVTSTKLAELTTEILKASLPNSTRTRADDVAKDFEIIYKGMEKTTTPT